MQIAHVDYLHSGDIGPAVHMLEASRSRIRTLLGTPAWCEALEEAHNIICDVQLNLQGEMEEDSEEGEMEEE